MLVLKGIFGGSLKKNLRNKNILKAKIVFKYSWGRRFPMEKIIGELKKIGPLVAARAPLFSAILRGQLRLTAIKHY